MNLRCNMKRFIWIFSIIIIVIVAVFSYQYFIQNNEEHNKKMFDVVMSEKMQQLYDQSQDWAKPLQFDVHDSRLHGDYKVLSEFLLNYWMQNIEARNQYLRELQTEKWEQFLNVDRLEMDKKNNFKESTQMLIDVRKSAEKYQKITSENKKQSLNNVNNLKLNPEMKKALYDKLESNMKVQKSDSLFVNEIQIMDKADIMLDMLKKYKWQVQDHQILFYEDAQVKKFNALYQDILNQYAKIDQKKEQNAEAVTTDNP